MNVNATVTAIPRTATDHGMVPMYTSTVRTSADSVMVKYQFLIQVIHSRQILLTGVSSVKANRLRSNVPEVVAALLAASALPFRKHGLTTAAAADVTNTSFCVCHAS